MIIESLIKVQSYISFEILLANTGTDRLCYIVSFKKSRRRYLNISVWDVLFMLFAYYSGIYFTISKIGPTQKTTAFNKVLPERDVTVLARRGVSAVRPPTCRRPVRRQPTRPVAGLPARRKRYRRRQTTTTTTDTTDRYYSGPLRYA